MQPIASCVTNPEIIGMLELIISAIRNPQLETEPCLDKLMETTFVNSMVWGKGRYTMDIQSAADATAATGGSVHAQHSLERLCPVCLTGRKCLCV